MLTENTSRMTGSGQTPVIAVVIPVFNCKEYLREAVDSVLGQPYQKISIVLVDDGSTDDSGQLCDELALENNRITALHQENAGVSTARNAGIQYVLSCASSSDYILFLDGDDGWTEDFFNESIVELLEKGYDLIGFQSCDCNSQLHPYGVPIAMTEGLHPGGQRSVWLHAKQSFAAMAYACRFFSKNSIRFFENLKYSEDKIFSMQCMYLADSIYLENRLLYLYRHTGNSAMNRRQYGIPYYVPIIDGYIRLDSLMHQQDSTRLPLSESCLMASIYIMDMVREHYRVFRSKGELDALFAANPNYIAIAEATGEYSDLKPNPAYIQYREHPTRYIIQNNLNGGIKICQKIIRKLLHFIK